MALAVVAGLVAVAVIAALGSSDSGDGGGRTVTQPGAPAPAFDLAGLRGGRVRLADLAGRPLVVNFWASWCVPCRKEFPALRAAQARYRSAGLRVVGITYKDLPGDARRFAREQKATWTLADGGVGDPVGREYGVRLIPQTFFVDAAGRIVARSYSGLSNAELDRQIRALLHSSQAKVRAASSGSATAQTSSTTSSPTGRLRP